MASGGGPSTSTDTDEAVLLRDWDFERFFPAGHQQQPRPTTTHIISSNNNKESGGIRLDDFHKLKLENRVKSEIFANSAKANHAFLNNLRATNNNNASPSSSSSSSSATPNKGHKRQDSDSKLSLNFVRGFRRENSDFFPMSKRHSAILGERPSAITSPLAAAQPQRSSAIFSRNKKTSEPILTDFVSTSSLLETPKKSLQQQLQMQQQQQQQQAQPQQPQPATPGRSFDFLRPRREKTESVILVRNTATRQLLLENIFSQQQVNNKKNKAQIYTKLCIHTYET